MAMGGFGALVVRVGLHCCNIAQYRELSTELSCTRWQIKVRQEQRLRPFLLHPGTLVQPAADADRHLAATGKGRTSLAARTP